MVIDKQYSINFCQSSRIIKIELPREWATMWERGDFAMLQPLHCAQLSRRKFNLYLQARCSLPGRDAGPTLKGRSIWIFLFKL